MIMRMVLICRRRPVARLARTLATGNSVSTSRTLRQRPRTGRPPDLALGKVVRPRVEEAALGRRSALAINAISPGCRAGQSACAIFAPV